MAAWILAHYVARAEQTNPKAAERFRESVEIREMHDALTGVALSEVYAMPPTGRNSDPPLRFRVLEVIRGKEVPLDFELLYRPGAEFLLMLKKRDAGYTVEWYPMGPVNEQLRSSDAPWLAWVRKEAQQK